MLQGRNVQAIDSSGQTADGSTKYIYQESNLTWNNRTRSEKKKFKNKIAIYNKRKCKKGQGYGVAKNNLYRSC